MLEEYGRKRNFKHTPEPPAKERAGAGKLTFVVQKHAARRLHYDFRLEIDDVLVSWAVPKGPSLNPGDKRLAVQTENHPMAYGHFEGVIPPGQYGAGPVIIWDEGTYSPDAEGKTSWHNRTQALDRMRAGLKKGKISFYLHGNKLQGSYTLFRLAGSTKDWILLKHKDDFATGEDLLIQDRSVISGKTIEEIRAGKVAKTPFTDWADQPGVKKSAFPTTYQPMLASLTDGPFQQQGWIFEPKLDGIRAIALINKGRVKLLSRRCLDLTGSFPMLIADLAEQSESLIIDGEIVALDNQGRPSFQLLQQRSGLAKTADIKSAEVKAPIVYYAFDIVRINDRNIEALPLSERKRLLKQNLSTSTHVQIIDALTDNGPVAYQACVENGLEGIMAKRIDSRYEPHRRSKAWLKIKATISAEFVICGYTPGSGHRQRTFGSLILGYYKNGQLTYAGGCGTGFNTTNLQELYLQFKNLESKKSPFAQKIGGKKIIWLQPKLVAEIKFAQWTDDSILRAPVFLRLRPDKIASACTAGQIATSVHNAEPHEPVVHKDAVASATAANSKKQIRTVIADNDRDGLSMNIDENIVDRLTAAKDKVIIHVEGQPIAFSNLNKIFWPAHGNSPAITKRDFALYYLQVAPWLLPHMKDRPLTLMRFPHGIEGGKFYQKHWSKGLPEFVETVDLYGERAKGDQQYLLCNNLATLLWLAQIANLELHTWQSRIAPAPDAYSLPTKFTGSLQILEQSLLNFPDYLLFDLDPYIYSGAEKSGDEPQLNHIAFKQCCQLAKWLKALFDGLSIESFIKTTGKTGLHIYVPIVRNLDFDQVRAISATIGKAATAEHPEQVTMEWAVVRRTGKTFLDHNMNARGKTLASIFSPRVYPQATVSMPLSWTELDHIYPSDFTMHNVPQLLRKHGDIWARILSHKNDLNTILNKNPRAASS